MDENFEKVKKEVDQFFTLLGVEGQIEILPPKDSTYFVNIKTDDPQSLIGEKGETLFEIQHLLKAILKRKINENFYIDLDVNDYKKKKIKYLKDLAKEIADEVALTKKEKILTSNASLRKKNNSFGISPKNRCYNPKHRSRTRKKSSN